MPRVRREVAIYPLDDDLVLYSAHRGESFVLNRTGALIWSCCDGRHPLAAIARRLAHTYGIHRRQALQDVRALVSRLHQAGLVVVGPTRSLARDSG
jgi:PqqD family protein of HPr-rel-A system